MRRAGPAGAACPWSREARRGCTHALSTVSLPARLKSFSLDRKQGVTQFREFFAGGDPGTEPEPVTGVLIKKIHGTFVGRYTQCQDKCTDITEMDGAFPTQQRICACVPGKEATLGLLTK